MLQTGHDPSEQRTTTTATPEATAVGSRSRYNTRGHRVVSTPGSGSGGSPGRAVTPQQAALCEVLYDLYAGVVPARGIESRTVRECDLSVRGKNNVNNDGAFFGIY